MKVYIKLLFQFIFYFIYINSVDYLVIYLLDITDNLPIYNYTVNTIIYSPLLIILLIVNKYKFNHLGNNNKISFKLLIISVIAIVAFRIIEDPFFRLNNILLKEEINIPVSYSFNLKQLVGYFLGIVILAPIVEELFFRKYMIDKLVKKNYVIATILPSLFFAGMHIKFPNIFLSFVMGLILSLMYLKYRDVRYTIIFHSGYNLLWLLLFIYNHHYWLLIKTLNFNFIYWSIVIISIVVLFLIIKFTIVHRKNITKEETLY